MTKIGFPFVYAKTNETAIIWLFRREPDTKSGEEPGVIYTNQGYTHRLWTKNPFARQVSYIDSLMPILAGDKILELSVEDQSKRRSSPSDLLEESEASPITFLNISPESAGAALALAAETISLDELSPPYVLISGQIEDHGSPRFKSLDAPAVVRLKADLLLNDTDLILLLHPDDFRNLLKLTAGDDRFKEIAGDSKDMADSEAFKKALERGKRLFPLPLNRKGDWAKKGRGNWRQALGRTLELDLSPESPPNGTSDAPKEKAEQKKGVSDGMVGATALGTTVGAVIAGPVGALTGAVIGALVGKIMETEVDKKEDK